MASATPTPTARPLSSRTPTAGTPGVVLGPPLIDKAYGVPNPNPTAISFHLQGAVDNVSVQLYSRAMVLFWGGSSGSEAAGWDRFNLPASALAGAGNGVCYAVLTPLRNGSAGKRVVLSLMVLR